MSGVRNPRHISAAAVVPEQITAYVEPLSGGAKARIFGCCVAYESEGYLTLAAYPPHDPKDKKAVAEAVALALCAAAENRAQLVVLSAVSPADLSSPDGAAAHPPGGNSRAGHPALPLHKTEITGTDQWWAIDLPPPPPAQKLRNMLRRAARDIYIEAAPGMEHFSAEHVELIRNYVRSRPLAAGTAYIFEHIPKYLAACEKSMLFSARLKNDKSLAGMAVGDFSSLSTAFYLFAFRAENAPPGTADALLAALAKEGTRQGHLRLNLGLGVNPGIAFFKQKWGAYKFLPYIETTYTLTSTGGLFAFLRNLW